jgi:type 1 glutamine amidotransferase
MKKNVLLWTLALMLFLLGTASISAANHHARTISILIVDGFSNHDWQQTTKVTKWLLEQSGRFSVSVSTVPADSVARQKWLPQFEKFDAVIQNTNNINNKAMRWPRPAQLALEKYVAQGGGLYVLHSANNAFSEWEAYNKMIGLGWRNSSYGVSLELDSMGHITRHQPGQSASTTHGSRFDATIKILSRHPINKGYPVAWKTADTEVYSNPRGPAENLTVLSYAYDINSKKYWPTEWVVRYGKGRVYNSTMGHLWAGDIYPKAWRCAGYQTTLLRAVEWVATGKVTQKMPADFPTATTVSLRAEQDFPAMAKVSSLP